MKRNVKLLKSGAVMAFVWGKKMNKGYFGPKSLRQLGRAKMASKGFQFLGGGLKIPPKLIIPEQAISNRDVLNSKFWPSL